MKGLNKLALATAIAAAPFATQAMEPMSEKAMGDTTGQAGVTMELETNLSIDQIAYSQGDSTGSFLINNTTIGGVDDSDGDSTPLDLAINVDLVEDGEDQSDYGSTDLGRGSLNDGDALISVKNIENDPAAGPVDMNVSVDNMGLADSDGDQQATMITGLDMDMYLSQLDIIAQVEDLDGNTGDAGSLGVDAAFTIEDLDVTFDVASVELVDMRMAGAGTLSDLQTEDAATVANPNEVDPAVVSMDIGQGDAVAADIDEALNINLANFQADIWMPEINVGNNTGSGGSSIGSVGISNLQVTDTSIAVYGRE